MVRGKKLILAIVAIGGFAAIVLQYESLTKLRKDNERLRRRFDELSQARAGQPDSAIGANDSAAREQFSELLKLRGEVTQLRGQTNEIALLRQQNEALRASIKVATPAARAAEHVKKSPEDALPQDIHPKESWGFRGYDSPDATVESMMWGMTKGDKAAFLGGVSPEMQAEIEKNMSGKDFSEEMKSEAIGEFRVLDRQVVSDDEMVLTIYYTRQKENGDTTGNSEDTHFKKIGGQWTVKLFGEK